MTPEQSLVFAASHGNEKCFEELYQRNYQKVYALARITLKNDADAEEALQNTFISAWRNINRLEDVSAFNTWIRRITLNECYSLLRKRKYDISIDITEDDGDSEPVTVESDVMLPEVYAEQTDLKERLRRIVDDLSDVQRQTIMLFYFDEMTVTEIAAAMDCSENTVKSRLFLARRAIKTEIEEQECRSGQKFYGIAGIPTVAFAKLFTEQIRNAALPQSTAMDILSKITGKLGGSVAQTVSRAGTMRRTASRGIKAQDAAPKAVSHAAAPQTSAGGFAAKTAAAGTTKAAAAHAAGGAAKALIVKIAAGIVAAGILAGGAVGVVNIARRAKKDEGFAGKMWAESRTEASPDACSAYLDLLVDNKDAIDAYYWQKGYNPPVDGDVPSDEKLSRAVVVDDCYGDGTPELIFVKADSDYSASLCVFTFENGAVKELATKKQWSNIGGGGQVYYLFQTGNDKTLRAFHSEGDVGVLSRYFVLEDESGLAEEYRFSKMAETVVDGETQYDISYLKNASEPITEAEYENAAADLRSDTVTVLMYSEGCGDFAQDFVSSHGCPAMTCTEAIDYLRGILGISSETYLDVDSLPGSLTDFLRRFYVGYSNLSGDGEADKKSFESSRASDSDSNILFQIVSNPSCVDFSIYPGTEPVYHWGEPDPMGWSEGASYAVFDKGTVEWIAGNIFNVSDEDLQILAEQGEERKWFHSDGASYYVPTAGVGGIMFDVQITLARLEGDKYFITYDAYYTGWLEVKNDPRSGQLEYLGTYYAELEYKEIDGSLYWSLYKHCETSRVGPENDSGDADSQNGPEAGPKEETPPEPVITDYVYEEHNGKSYDIFAVVRAYDADGNVVWEHRTGNYPLTEIHPLAEIGVRGDRYYLVEGGTVYCLDRYTGLTVWKYEWVGGSNTFCFDGEDSLYISGWYGPMLLKIDSDGNLVWDKGAPGYNPTEIWLYDEHILAVKGIPLRDDQFILVSTEDGSVIREVDKEEAADWSSLYRDFVLNGEFAKSEEYEFFPDPFGESDPEVLPVVLKDISDDGIPELFINNCAEAEGMNYIFVFTVENGEVVFLGYLGGRHSWIAVDRSGNYPGVFCFLGSWGVYRCEYSVVKDNKVETDTLFVVTDEFGEKDYESDDSFRETGDSVRFGKINYYMKTEDAALYECAKGVIALDRSFTVNEKNPAYLPAITVGEIRNMGWDGFIDRLRGDSIP